MNSHFHTFMHQLKESEIDTLCCPDSDDEKSAIDLLIEVRNRADQAIRFVVGEVPELKPTPELFKLPYPVCWFEFTMASQGVVQRDRVRHAVLVWSTEETFEFSWFTENSYDRWCFISHSSITFPITEDSGGTVWCRDELPPGQTVSDGFEIGVVDGLISILACILSAINCTNVRRVEVQPPKQLQKAREKRKKLPLYSFWTLELALAKEKNGSIGGSHASPRLHLRRGHAREYRPGKFCWVQPHAVGNKALGVVHKDYAYRSEALS